METAFAVYLLEKNNFFKELSSVFKAKYYLGRKIFI